MRFICLLIIKERMRPMFKHEVIVNGNCLYGDITKDENHHIFKLTDYYSSGGSKLDSDHLREFAKELNLIANELDRINGKNTLSR